MNFNPCSAKPIFSRKQKFFLEILELLQFLCRREKYGDFFFFFFFFFKRELIDLMPCGVGHNKRIASTYSLRDVKGD